MDTQERKIVGAIRLGHRMYTAGDEAALARALPAKDIARLHGKGVIAGDWGTAQAGGSVERIDGGPMVRAEDGLIHGEPIVGDGSGVVLPELTGDEENVSSEPEAPVAETPVPKSKPAAKRAKKTAAKSTKATKKGRS